MNQHLRLELDNQRKRKDLALESVYFFFSDAFTGALEAALFGLALTGFIGCSQHTSSQVS